MTNKSEVERVLDRARAMTGPLIFFLRDRPMLEVKHEFLGASCVNTNIKVQRDGVPIFSATEARSVEILAKHFNQAVIANLPAVQDFAAIKAKEAAFNAALPDIETNEAKMIAQLSGHALAEALSSVEQNKNAVRVFQRQLATSEAAARAAIVENFASVLLPAMRAQRDAAEQAARDRLEKAIAPIADELAILDQVAISLNDGVKGRIVPQLDELLRKVTMPPAKPAK